MSIYDFEVTKINGQKNKLEDYQGQVMLIVNTASKCGYAPQLTGFEELYKKYGEKGLAVLGFPSNQFLNQEPGTDAEISEICKLNYGVTFPMHSKIKVNGKDELPLYTYLKKEMNIPKITWNFNKFLVDQNGNVIKYYDKKITPEEIEKDIIELIN